MERPLTLNREELKQIVEDKYGFRPDEVNFHPVGCESWVYYLRSGETHTNNQVFKVSRTVPDGILGHLARLQQIRPILFRPEVYQSRDQDLAIDVLGYRAYMQQSIQGDEVGRTATEQDKQKMGLMLRLVHSEADYFEADQTMPREQFNRYLALVESVYSFQDDQSVPYGSELLQLNQAHAARIDRLLAGYRNFGTYLRSEEIPFVLCHGDAHIFNFMRDDRGLWMIDWDRTQLAPKEKDLHFYTSVGDDGVAVLDEAVAYGYGSDTPLNQHVLLFYRFEFVFQELADYGTQIMTGGSDAELAIQEYAKLFEAGGAVDQALALLDQFEAL